MNMSDDPHGNISKRNADEYTSTFTVIPWSFQTHPPPDLIKWGSSEESSAEKERLLRMQYKNPRKTSYWLNVTINKLTENKTEFPTTFAPERVKDDEKTSLTWVPRRVIPSPGVRALRFSSISDEVGFQERLKRENVDYLRSLVAKNERADKKMREWLDRLERVRNTEAQLVREKDVSYQELKDLDQRLESLARAQTKSAVQLRGLEKTLEEAENGYHRGAPFDSRYEYAVGHFGSRPPRPWNYYDVQPWYRFPAVNGGALNPRPFQPGERFLGFPGLYEPDLARPRSLGSPVQMDANLLPGKGSPYPAEHVQPRLSPRHCGRKVNNERNSHSKSLKLSPLTRTFSETPAFQRTYDRLPPPLVTNYSQR